MESQLPARGGELLTIAGADAPCRTGRFYGCADATTRGAAICKNSLLAKQELLAQVLVKALAHMLDGRMRTVAVEKALPQLRAGQDLRLDCRTAIERELSLIETAEAQIVDAIVAGEQTSSLVARLKIEEARKHELVAELDALSKPVVELDAARLTRELRTRVKDTKALLSRQPPHARQRLNRLIEDCGPLKCEPIEEDGRKD